MRLKGSDAVVYVSAGEGTCSQGDFHEALNWASREKLPVIFMIENNKYAISVHISEQIAGQSVYRMVAGYANLDRYDLDGTDYLKSFEVYSKAYERARRGDGPSLIEAHVPRLQSHSISDNHLKYRTAEDIAKEQERCPIRKLRALLVQQKHATDKELDTLTAAIKKEIDEAAEWAETQPEPQVSDALTFNYVDETPWAGITEVEPTGPDSYMVDALNHALDEEMQRNPDMCIFGQDVAHGKGGVFTVTTGLTSKFGKKRVFNAPLAESSIVGVAIGMASVGMRPVAEIQFGDYIWTAMMYYRSGGDFSCPAVLRVPVGGYIHGGCYHSQNIEATFAHFPGL
ncbi:MAG: tungsten formylmethanofuran dehydrogenase, partial [Betaproteobacteria bacterium]|nr:tungsten formylmethanofuran dehydrogenase [Betaproteobacteria bacterium]